MLSNDNSNIKILTYNKEYILTRYLYAKDEVEIMLLSAILTKNIEESYYWCFELYYSGFILSDLIWKIYYDFYFDKNPKLEIFIRKKLSTDVSIDTYIHIIQNFINRLHTCKVFTIRQFIGKLIDNELLENNIDHKKYSLRGRKPIFCKLIDKKYQNLMIFINKKNYEGIAYHIYNLFIINNSSYYDLFVNLLRYTHNINNKKSAEEFEKSYNDNYCNIQYNKFIKINKGKNLPMCYLFIAFIVNIMTLMENDSRESSINILDKSSASYIIEHEQKQIDKVYNTLKIKRLYNIHGIGCFRLTRNHFDDLQNDILGSWEYYTKNTPCWCDRFNKFKASFGTKLIFENDDLLEKFYELYGYEPDEQNKEIQNQAIGALEPINCNKWCKKYFKDFNQIFPDDFLLIF
tara:strand:- start:1339 stop:2550 length:1212 start_codon:yes stop_codon:yes gene_type:complete